jgi:DNA-binding transcriptional ArsR family regulator
MKENNKPVTAGIADGFSLADEPTLRAVALLKVLAHEHRLRILCELVSGPSTVKRIGDLAGIAQPFLSQHLAVLRAQGLVCAEREGRQVRYALCSPAAAGVIRALHAAFCGSESELPVAFTDAAQPAPGG